MSRAYDPTSVVGQQPPEPTPLPVPQPNPPWPGPRHAAPADTYPAHALGVGVAYRPRHAAPEER